MTVITPATLHLKRKNSYVVSIEKDGYESASVTFTTHLSGWLWGNVLFPVLIVIGLPVDFITGGAKKLTPDNITISLARLVDEQGVADKYKAIPQEAPGTKSLETIKRELYRLDKKVEKSTEPTEPTEPLEGLETKLKKLEELKAEQLLTEEEYLELRKKIINKH
jgi:hypothetical protein